MESVSANKAYDYYSAVKFMHQAGQTCYDKCVVDFQVKDISAMEKECANACLNKHMSMFNSLIMHNVMLNANE